jgi:predicted Zn-dependent peptidase
VGGDLNAAIRSRHRYCARVLKADVPLALDVLSDILADPSFDPEELKREQNVIVQEIGASEDTPDDLVFDKLQAIAFPDQPVGRSILGSRKTVRSFDRKRLHAYLTRNYRAPNMVVAAAGAVDHRAVVAEVEHRFASFVGPSAPEPESARFVGGSDIEKRDLEQVHVALAMHGVPQRDSNLFSLQVFTSVLGGGMSSRLFQEVRETRGLCYAIYAFLALFDTACSASMPAPTRDLPDLMRVVVDQDHRRRRDHHRGRNRRAKAQMKAGLDGARKLERARAARGRCSPGAVRTARRTGRPDRGGDRRERARRRPRADCARTPGGRRARPRSRP